MLRFFQGMALGLSIVFPGISGGTLAFLLGIYNKIINEISQFQFIDLTDLSRIKSRYDWSFWLPLALGMFVSISTFLFFSDKILQNYIFEFYSLILGFSIASIGIAFDKIKKTRELFIWFIASVLLSGALIHFIDFEFNIPLTKSNLVFWMGIAGGISGVALMIPGVSGSYLLLLLGLYSGVIEMFQDLNWVSIMSFVFFLAIVVLVVSKLMKRLFSKYETLTWAIVSGLVLTSLFLIWPFSYNSSLVRGDFDEPKIFIIFFLIGSLPLLFVYFYKKFYRR